MAKTNSANAARIAGALNGLAALRQLERDANNIANLDDTPEAYHGKRLTDANAFAAAFGQMTPEQESAIVAVAEFIHSWISTAQPNIEPGAWLPLAAMTEAEARAMIEAEAAEQAAFDEAWARERDGGDQAAAKPFGHGVTPPGRERHH
jgi:hypothetical protein